MDTYQTFEFILELNQIAAGYLIDSYYHKNSDEFPLVFPKDVNNKLRISEQELRFAFGFVLAQRVFQGINCSFETPTENIYSFNGTTPRRASTDMTIYFNEGDRVNIEFKSKNPSVFSINKDLDKLVKEEHYGAWCHVFENQDKATLMVIFEKIKKSLDGTLPKRPLHFSFLILKSRMLISRKGKDSDLIGFDPDRIFTLKYDDVLNNSSIGKHFIGDWQIDVF